MDPRGALAQLFLAGRSPEEQQARLLQQKIDSGMMGAPAQAPVAATDPLKTAGVMAAAAPTSAPVPTPRPSQFALPQEGPVPMPNPGAPFPPDLGVSPQMPPDPMAASAPTDSPPVRPQMPPPVMGVPPDLRGTPQNSLGGGVPLSPDLAVSPPRPPDPMRGAPTEIGAFNAREQQRGSRKAKTKKAQGQFKLKAGLG